MTTRVVNCHVAPFDLLADGYVYIGRPSVWGNPFKLPRGATEIERLACINRFREYLRTRPDLIARARAELRGKVLGCFCHPKACHGDVLAAVADGAEP